MTPPGGRVLAVCRSASSSLRDIRADLVDGRLILAGVAPADAEVQAVCGSRTEAARAGGGFELALRPDPGLGLVRLVQDRRIAALLYVECDGPETAPAIPSESPPLTEAVGALVGKWGLAGAVLVDRPDRGDPLVSAFGFADRAARRPMTADSRFRIGSLSKLITALLCHRLADRGVLDPAAPASRWLPADLGPVTVRDLLANRSGLDLDVDGPWPFLDAATLEEDLRPAVVPDATVAALLADARRTGRPGGAFRYLTANYWILGRVAEAAAGRPYAELAHAEVLDPAGLSHVRLGASFPDRREDGEVSYAAEPDARLAPATAFGLAGEVPAGYAACVPQRDAMGGWVLSVPELARLGAAAEGLLPSAAARDAFWGRGLPPVAANWHYGQGAFVRPDDGGDRPLWWVFGGIEGACGIVARWPGRVVAVMATGTPLDRDIFLAALWRTIFRTLERKGRA